jgi:hypothetical protein
VTLTGTANHVGQKASLARTRLVRAEIMKIRTTSTWLLLLAGVAVSPHSPCGPAASATTTTCTQRSQQ